MCKLKTIMKLKMYLKANGLTVQKFAQLTSFSMTKLTRAMHGEHIPGDDLAIEVEEFTGGQVTAVEFTTDCFLARQKFNAKS